MAFPMLSLPLLLAAGQLDFCYLHPYLKEAATHLLTTISATNLHLVFQGDVDHCLVESVWRSGFTAKIMKKDSFWDAMAEASYRTPLQLLLVGNAVWISSTLIAAQNYYKEAKISTKLTQWLWIATSFEGPPTTVSGSDSFSDILDVVSDALTEGVRGALAYRRLREGQESFGGTGKKGVLKEWVTIASVEDPGDGVPVLQTVAIWTPGGLRIKGPLWPSVPFDLRGRTLRINVLKKPTVFLYEEGEGLKEAEGYAADLTRILQMALNFSAVLVLNTGFGAYSNGSWNGMVGDLHRGLADVSPMDFTPIWQRTSAIDFGIIYSTDNVVIISRAPSVFIKPLLLLQIFTPPVWACLAGVGVVSGAGLWALLRARRLTLQKEEKKVHALSYMGASIKILVFQGSKIWPAWTGGRLVSGTMMLLAVIIGSVYSGSITAFLAIPFRSEPINSLEDLLESDALPAVRILSSPYSFFLTENSGVLGERVRKVMQVFKGTEMSTWEFLEKVAKGKYGFIDTASSAVGRSGQFERRNKPCRFHIGRNPVRMDLDAFAYPKNSPIKEQFDKVMRWLRSYGIIEHTKGKYYSQTCSPLIASDGPLPISVTQAQGAFYVLGIGLILAFVAFLTELATKCVK